MSDKTNVTRRTFMKSSTAAMTAAAVAGPAINVLGANEKINMGLIGPGRRGRAVTNLAQQMSAETGKVLNFMAVADIFEGWRELAVMEIERNRMRYELPEDDDIQTYDNHMDLLENKDIDAVFIATPEHTHAQHILDTIAAGKDMYVEKPMVHTVQEGLDVLKAADGKDIVIQVGTQRRSVPLYKQAAEMVKNGDIGKVNYCEGWWFRNWPDNAGNPAWRYEIPNDASEDTIDWQAFLGPAPKVPFDKNRYFQWRCYWDYSNGIGSDLMVHQLDAILMVMGVGMPSSVVSSGDIYRYDDGRTTPDTWSSIFEYTDQKFQVNYRGNFSTSLQDFGIRICGTDATLEMPLSAALHVVPDPAGNKPDMEPKSFYYPEDNTNADFMVAHFQSVKDHFENFYDCVKSRETPNCSVVDGFNGAALSTMAVMAYQEGKRLNWDAENQKVTS